MNIQSFANKLSMALMLLLAAVGVAQATGVDDGFNPDASGAGPSNAVMVIEQQRNGQLLLGGKFTTIGGATRNLVARVNNDGSRSSFNPDVTGNSVSSIRALLEQPDGSVLIAGRFITVSGQPRMNIARVSSAGLLDTTFDPGTNEIVQALASQWAPDGLSGEIYVAGNFTTIGGMARPGIARLHADGSVDTSFVPPEFHQSFNALKIQPDGRILVAGYFNSIGGVDTGASIARINPDGSLDPTFNATVSDHGNMALIGDIAVQADGKILIAGRFDSVGGQARNSVARLNADGQLDTGFAPPAFNSQMSSMLLQSDGRIVVGGSFDNDPGREGIARLNADGSYDLSFSAEIDGKVQALVQQTDGKYAVGGSFTHVDTIARNHIARLDANGAADVDFIADVSAGPDVVVNVLALQTDGKVLVGGQAASGNSPLMRLRSNGMADTSFNSTVDGDVSSLISYPDGTTLVAGQFTNIGQRIARLQSDGTVDNSFAASADGNVYATALQRNGRILMGGAFSHVDTLARQHLARIFDNGAPDLTFHPVFNGDVYAITIQADGKSLVGGNFTTVNGNAKPYLVRLNTNGTIDASFDADVDNLVRAIATDANGRILIGGLFANVDSTARAGIARLQVNGDLDPSFDPPSYSAGTIVTTIAPVTNGRILIGGFTLSTNTTGFVRRLSSNGSQNTGTDPVFEIGSYVTSLLVQPDGKLVFGGNFDHVDGKPRTNVARFAQGGAAIESMQLNNGTDLSWERKGSAPELIAPPQVLWSLSCCDSADFNLLPNGIMSRSGSVWTLTGTPNLGPDTLWLRAVSIAGDGGHAVGTIESPIIMLLPDRIFADGFE